MPTDVVRTDGASLVLEVPLSPAHEHETDENASPLFRVLRTFATAFETYAQEKGNWPSEVEAGITPPEMTDRLNNTAWARITPPSSRR